MDDDVLNNALVFSKGKFEITLKKIGIALAIKFVTDYIFEGEKEVVKEADMTELDSHIDYSHFGHYHAL